MNLSLCYFRPSSIFTLCVFYKESPTFSSKGQALQSKALSTSVCEELCVCSSQTRDAAVAMKLLGFYYNSVLIKCRREQAVMHPLQ